MEYIGIVGIVTDMHGTMLYAAGPGVRVAVIKLLPCLDANEAPTTLTGPWRVTSLRLYLGPGTRPEVRLKSSSLPNVYAGALGNLKSVFS